MKSSTPKPRFTIRYRTVRGTKDYEKSSSGEYQVLDGRRIVARFDYEHHAQAHIVKLCAASNPRSE